MTDNYKPKTRQEIYDHIRATSKDEYILEEMVRLGFWPSSGKLPDDPVSELHRMREIRGEIQKLQEQLTRTTNVEALRRELRERRMRESKEKQRKTKEQRTAERKARAEAWSQRKRRELLYLGEGVSSGLSSVDRETLRKFRALLFQIEKDGPEGKRWGDAGDGLAAAVGYATFVAMVTPDKGRPLRARAMELQAR